MLYLVSTPIGNLADITHRAIQVLKNCDYILCEDTRHSLGLLKHYGIEKPLKSFHQFNEKSREDDIVADLKNGKEIALISDAGTPGICDPGETLVKRCRSEGLKVTAIPGASAWVMGLVLSTMRKDKVQFLGFLPKIAGERKKILASMMFYSGTSVCYETPHRIKESLEEMRGFKRVAVMRELTKTFEECLEGTAEELWNHFQKNEPRGEIVLLVEGEPSEDLPVEELVKVLEQKFNLSLAEAIKTAAELKGIPKREVYQSIHCIAE